MLPLFPLGAAGTVFTGRRTGGHGPEVTPWRPAAATRPGPCAEHRALPRPGELEGALITPEVCGHHAPGVAAKPRRGGSALCGHRRSSAAQGLLVKDARSRLRPLLALLQTCPATPREALPRPPPLSPSETASTPPSPAATRPLSPGPATAVGDRPWARSPPSAGTSRGTEGPNGAEVPEAAASGGRAARVRVCGRQTLRSPRHHLDPSAGARSRHLPPSQHFNSRAPSRLLPPPPRTWYTLPRAACWEMWSPAAAAGTAGARWDCKGCPLGEPTAERHWGGGQP